MRVRSWRGRAAGMNMLSTGGPALAALQQSLEQPGPMDPKSPFPISHLCHVPGAAQLQVRDRKGIRNPRDLVQN